jgi:hypothetical protein
MIWRQLPQIQPHSSGKPQIPPISATLVVGWDCLLSSVIELTPPNRLLIAIADEVPN